MQNQTPMIPPLLVREERLWSPLENLLAAFNAQLQEDQGWCAFCYQQQQCCLLDPDATWQYNGVQYVDIFWLAEAMGLCPQSTPREWLTEAIPGKMAPDLRLPDLDGHLHSLSEFRGRRTVVYVWGSW